MARAREPWRRRWMKVAGFGGPLVPDAFEPAFGVVLTLGGGRQLGGDAGAIADVAAVMTHRDVAGDEARAEAAIRRIFGQQAMTRELQRRARTEGRIPMPDGPEPESRSRHG